MIRGHRSCVAIRQNVIPGEPESLPRTRYGVGRDPWFDRPFDRLTVLSKVEGLTTLSEVEGESRKIAENEIILDLPTP
jgi:hypothetical protein